MIAPTSVRTLLASVLGLVATCLMTTPASADLCASTTNCTLTFTQGNGGSGFGSGNFGTLNLALSGTTVTVTIDLATGFFIIGTGFPGAAGFSDSLGGGLTIGNFSSAAYSGFSSHATSDLHFDGFGFFNNAAGTTAPSAGSASAVNVLSFDVTQGGLNDVEQLLNLANPLGGDGAAYFVVDAINRNTSGPGAGKTGLIAITGGGSSRDVPEPTTLVLLGLGLFSLAFIRRRT
jgi:PEP-CTERM motif-containing protein